MNKKHVWLLAYFGIAMIGFLSGFYLYEPNSRNSSHNYIHPYREYSSVLTYGDTSTYNKIVKDRREKTPSHPDYFDLSVLIAAKFGYTAGYYNAYLALRDLYKYNHFTMGDNVKRLMFGYLQLAIDNKDPHITPNDLKSYQTEFPEGRSQVFDSACNK